MKTALFHYIYPLKHHLISEYDLANKKAKGKKGAIVAIVKGTKAEAVIKILHKTPLKQRKKVKEVTLVIDRFHVQKLGSDALQEIRIKHRWEAIDAKNDAIENAKNKSLKYTP